MHSDEYVFKAEPDTDPKKAEQQRLKYLNQVYNQKTLPALSRFILPGMRILEIGPGNGEISHELSRMIGPSGHYVGVDRDEGVITPLRSKFADRENINWVTSDVRDLKKMAAEIGGPFDVIFCRWVLSHIPETQKSEALSDIYQLLKPTGKFICEDCDMYQAYVVHAEDLTRVESPALEGWKAMARKIEISRELNFGLSAKDLSTKLKLDGYKTLLVDEFQGVLRAEQKQALSLVMLVMHQLLIDCKIMTSEEVSLLSSGLKALADDPRYAVVFVKDAIVMVQRDMPESKGDSRPDGENTVER